MSQLPMTGPIADYLLSLVPDSVIEAHLEQVRACYRYGEERYQNIAHPIGTPMSTARRLEVEDLQHFLTENGALEAEIHALQALLKIRKAPEVTG